MMRPIAIRKASATVIGARGDVAVLEKGKKGKLAAIAAGALTAGALIAAPFTGGASLSALPAAGAVGGAGVAAGTTAAVAAPVVAGTAATTTAAALPAAGAVTAGGVTGGLLAGESAGAGVAAGGTAAGGTAAGGGKVAQTMSKIKQGAGKVANAGKVGVKKVGGAIKNEVVSSVSDPKALAANMAQTQANNQAQQAQQTQQNNIQSSQELANAAKEKADTTLKGEYYPYSIGGYLEQRYTGGTQDGVETNRKIRPGGDVTRNPGNEAPPLENPLPYEPNNIPGEPKVNSIESKSNQQQYGYDVPQKQLPVSVGPPPPPPPPPPFIDDLPKSFWTGYNNHGMKRLGDTERVMNDERQEVIDRVTESMREYLNEDGTYKQGVPTQIAIRTHIFDEVREPKGLDERGNPKSHGDSLVAIVNPHNDDPRYPALRTLFARYSEFQEGRTPQEFSENKLTNVQHVIHAAGMTEDERKVRRENAKEIRTGKGIRELRYNGKDVVHTGEPMDIAMQMLKMGFYIDESDSNTGGFFSRPQHTEQGLIDLQRQLSSPVSAYTAQSPRVPRQAPPKDSKDYEHFYRRGGSTPQIQSDGSYVGARVGKDTDGSDESIQHLGNVLGHEHTHRQINDEVNDWAEEKFGPLTGQVKAQYAPLSEEESKNPFSIFGRTPTNQDEIETENQRANAANRAFMYAHEYGAHQSDQSSQEGVNERLQNRSDTKDYHAYATKLKEIQDLIAQREQQQQPVQQPVQQPPIQTGEPMDIAMQMLKWETPPCPYCQGTGKDPNEEGQPEIGIAPGECEPCDGTGKEMFSEEPVVLDERGMPIEDDTWRDSVETGEPMDIAMRLLKNNDERRKIEDYFEEKDWGGEVDDTARDYYFTMGWPLTPFNRMSDRQVKLFSQMIFNYGTDGQPTVSSYWREPFQEAGHDYSSEILMGDGMEHIPDEAYDELIRYHQHFNDAVEALPGGPTPQKNGIGWKEHWDLIAPQPGDPPATHTHPHVTAQQKMEADYPHWGWSDDIEGSFQEHYGIEHENRQFTPQMDDESWRDNIEAGEPMDIAMRLLKESVHLTHNEDLPHQFSQDIANLDNRHEITPTKTGSAINNIHPNMLRTIQLMAENYQDNTPVQEEVYEPPTYF